jgi:hypothetical protein
LNRMPSEPVHPHPGLEMWSTIGPCPVCLSTSLSGAGSPRPHLRSCFRLEVLDRAGLIFASRFICGFKGINVGRFLIFLAIRPLLLSMIKLTSSSLHVLKRVHDYQSLPVRTYNLSGVRAAVIDRLPICARRLADAVARSLTLQ